MAKSLCLHSSIAGYDPHHLISHLAPSIPSGCLLVFWRGFGGDLLQETCSGGQTKEQLCHRLVLYTVYMLMYELASYLQQLVRRQLPLE